MKSLTTTFRTKPKNLTLNLYKETGMNGSPYVVELIEELADEKTDTIKLRYDRQQDAEQMARDLTRMLANAELKLEDDAA